MNTKLIFIPLYLATLLAFGQGPMDPGFSMLENGDFESAEAFFDSYLEKEPKNKTALICYGRAVGLNGRPENASFLFESLLEEYPGDLEIQLNLYESLLWREDYEKAKGYYQALVKQNPNNFSALLGFANTLSNLKQFKDALYHINKAILLQPKNISARTSRKYIRLGLANQLATAKKFTEGILLLTEIFEDFPGDREVLLSLANLNIQAGALEEAKASYWKMATHTRDSIIALAGVALVEHLDEQDKAALQTAEQAKDMAAPFVGEPEYQQARERYLQALIWNGKYKEVQKQLDSLAVTGNTKNWVLALEATLGMYTGDFRKSQHVYDELLARDSLSFDGNLGMANALYAKGDFNKAYQAVYRTLEIFPNQKDAASFLEKLDRQFRPVVSQQAGYTFDNGNNTAFLQSNSLRIPVSTKLIGTLSYQYRSTENTLSGAEATSNLFAAGLEYQLLPGIALNANLGVNKSEFADASYSLPISGIKLQLKPYKLQNLELGYAREVQNFNADLIAREIVMNHYGLNYNLGTNINLGWFTQLMHTRQSDGNNRNLLFSSLYYTLMKKPALKIGVNYQYISFTEQLPQIYFSPESFQAYELFADSRGNLSSKLQYSLGVASGFQEVEDTDISPIFRADFTLKHSLSKRFDLGVYGKYSNIASAVASGFEFTELGINLRWALSKAPIFQTKP
ncbi:tetratricopeptide repeat protein [Flavobacteriaceae bacterium D16]|nr:tetratricopeptide repeat protein [Flavobacteriaceae bacterium D16]